MLRRSRDSHPEQAERVEGGCRGLAQYDLFLKLQCHLFEPALEVDLLL
jgi:hypothetical protein